MFGACRDVMELVWLGHEPMGNIHSDSIQLMVPWVNRISIIGKIRENRLFACFANAVVGCFSNMFHDRGLCSIVVG